MQINISNFSKNFILILLSVLLTYCGKKGKEKQGLSYSYKTVQRLHPRCKDDVKDNGCVKLHYTFPEFSMSQHKPIIDSLRQHTISFLFDSTSTNLKDESFDELASDWFTMYNTTLDKFPNYNLEWEESKQVLVLQQSSSFISIEFSEHEFSGGAHGIQEKYYASYSLPSGKKLLVRDVIQKNSYPKLVARVDSLFRKQKKLTGNDDMKKSGYWFKGGSFTLTDNFAITRKGLFFYYNPYEIAPYAEGPTGLLLPYKLANTLLMQPYRHTSSQLNPGNS